MSEITLLQAIKRIQQEFEPEKPFDNEIAEGRHDKRMSSVFLKMTGRNRAELGLYNIQFSIDSYIKAGDDAGLSEMLRMLRVIATHD